MPAPTINDITNILAYDQWKSWFFKALASDTSNLPITYWEASGLPPGLTIKTQTPYLATGVAATDFLTATGNTFANDDKVCFTELVGGAGLAPYTLYYVVAKSGDTMQLALSFGGAAINFTTDITRAIMRKAQDTGEITGAGTAPGVSAVELRAYNSAGVGRLVVPMIIIEADGSDSYYPDVTIDLVTREVKWPDALIKLHDDLVLRVGFTNAGAFIDLALDASVGLRLAVKQDETESVVVKGNKFLKVGGTGTSARYLLYVPAALPALVGALSDVEDAIEVVEGLFTTGFPALGEFSWSITNTTGISLSPAVPLLQQSSKTFVLPVERDIEGTQA